MTNLEPLHDVYAELERRADAVTARLTTEQLLRTPTRHRPRALLVAATVVGIVALAGGITVFAYDSTSHTQRSGSNQHSIAPATHGAPTSGATATSLSGPRTAEPITSMSDPHQIERAIVDRYEQVFGDAVSIELMIEGMSGVDTAFELARDGSAVVVSPNAPHAAFGWYVRGVLSADGVKGGFDLAINVDGPHAAPSCELLTDCTVSDLPDGSTLAAGQVPLDSDGVTYVVDLVRADGLEFILRVSNERNPSGDSIMLDSVPPLTIEQMVQIVTDSRW